MIAIQLALACRAPPAPSTPPTSATGASGDTGVVDQQGDCIDDPLAVDEVPLTEVTSQVTNLIHLDELPSDMSGMILEDESQYEDLMFRIGYDTIPVLPFPGIQAAAVWYHQPEACSLQIDVDEIHLLTDQDGGLVLNVQFYDSALNCSSACSAPQDLSVITVRYFADTEPPAKICRRIRPGCPP